MVALPNDLNGLEDRRTSQTDYMDHVVHKTAKYGSVRVLLTTIFESLRTIDYGDTLFDLECNAAHGAQTRQCHAVPALPPAHQIAKQRRKSPSTVKNSIRTLTKASKQANKTPTDSPSSPLSQTVCTVHPRPHPMPQKLSVNCVYSDWYHDREFVSPECAAVKGTRGILTLLPFWFGFQTTFWNQSSSCFGAVRPRPGGPPRACSSLLRPRRNFSSLRLLVSSPS